MNNNQMRVTVKRIKQVPTKYYAQIPQPKAIAKKRVKVEVADSLLAQRKRLTDTLRFRPATSTDFSGSLIAGLKNGMIKLKIMCIGGVSALLAMLRENASRLAFSCSVSMGAAAVACLVLACTCSVGYVITSEGQTLGVLKNKETYHRLLTEINQEIAYVSTESFAPQRLDFSVQLIPKGRFSDETDVKERLKATDYGMLPAYAVYADGEVLFALANEQTAREVLDGYMKSYTEGHEAIEAEFCEEVKISRRYVPRQALKTAESATETLKEGRIIFHQQQGNETAEEIAATYGVALTDLLEDNLIADWNLVQGRQLKIYTGKPLLSVKMKEFKTVKEEIPYQVIENEDPTRYEGTVYVEQEGAPGSRMIEAYITTVNGVETTREVFSNSMLSQAVDKVVKKGTKVRPSPIGTGQLAVPANGTLTSRFGSRWGRQHDGIDMGAAVGTPIYAADNGTVVYSEYNNGGYGYMIQIDHGNGVVTCYSHCNELLVPAGTVVAKGDKIATVGNTGRSTGPHLHFEVRKDGTPVDPLSYLKNLK